MRVERNGILGRELATEAAAILGIKSNQVRISHSPGRAVTIEVLTRAGWGDVPEDKKPALDAWALKLLQGA